MPDTIRSKETFRELFRRFSPASVREGTAIVDEIIDPITLLSEPLYSRVEQFIKQSALPPGATESELLDVVGQRWGVERKEGGRASGSVVLVFLAPEQIDLPEGATFLTQDRRRFEAERPYSFSKSHMTEREDGTYVSPKIEVQAAEEGGGYQVEAGEITVPGFELPSLMYCQNPQATTGGSTTETDQEYYERIRTAISSRAMDTPQGLLFVAAGQFAGEINRVTLIGAGDDEMRRDVQKVFNKTREVPLDVLVRVNRK